MKIHFVGALEGDKKIYEKVISALNELGHELLTDHSVKRSLKDVEKETPEEAELYAKKMKTWISRCDAVVVEVTTPNLGAGYEIATAIQLSKPVVVMYRPGPGNIPHVLKGLESDDKLQVITYNDATLKEAIKVALEYAGDSADTRFNFFISPAIGVYLDAVSKKKRLPRAVYLRRLIEEDMKGNKEYNNV